MKRPPGNSAAIPKRARWLAWLAQVGLLAPTFAADTDAGPAEKPAKLGQFVVNASLGQDSRGEGVAAIETVTMEEIARSGAAANLQEALRRIVPQFTGSRNMGAETGGAVFRSGGGSSLALRNLPTLVLLDGRRVAGSPVAAHVSGNAFVDLNVVPLAAVQAVDIITDGGAARHGADAVGGVINLRLAGGRRGATVGGFYETAPYRDGWSSRGGNFAFGQTVARTRFMLAGGWNRQDALAQNQRDFSSPVFALNFGGQIRIGNHFFVLNPALAAPPMAAEKPAVAFPLATPPVAPGGRPYFGTVGSDAVYWGKQDAAGRLVGFAQNELNRGSSPEAARVGFNVADWNSMLQERETRGMVLGLEHEFGERLSVFADLLAARTAANSQAASQGFGDEYEDANPLNPFAAPVSASHRVLALPRRPRWETRFERWLAGLRGKAEERLRFETALTLNRSRLGYVAPGQVDLALMRAAIAESRLNLFQRVVPEQELAATNIMGVANADLESTLLAWDGHVSREGPRLPGGSLQWTLGAEYRRDKLEGTGDRNSRPDADGRPNWGGAPTIQDFSAVRSVAAWFATLEAPIIAGGAQESGRRVEVAAGVRGEHTSDFSPQIVPEARVRWFPAGKSFFLRGGVSRTFNPPTLYQMAGPPQITTTSVQLRRSDGSIGSGAVNVQNVSHAGLQPERARNASMGFAFAPAGAGGFSFEADWVRIRQQAVIRRLPALTVLQDVEQRGAGSPYVAGTAGSLPGFDVRLSGFDADGQRVTAPGQIAGRLEAVYLTNPHQNLGERNVEALDMAIRYQTSGRHQQGDFEATLRVSYTASDVLLGAETAGRATAVNGTLPRWKTMASAAYRQGPWRGHVLHRYMASVRAEQDNFETGAYHVVDLGVSRRWGERVELSLMVKNAGQAWPRTAPLTFTSANADLGTYDPLGRSWLLSVIYHY